MKKLIYDTAYKLCSTEVKMLLDKLDAHKDEIGLTVLSKQLTPSHGYLHIVNTGKFSLAERIAVTSKVNEIHRFATKLKIVETIFEGEQRAENRVSKMGGYSQTAKSLLTSADIKTQALNILEQEMAKSYNDALRSHIDEHKAINKATTSY
jgi:hypothetical protein